MRVYIGLLLLLANAFMLPPSNAQVDRRQKTDPCGDPKPYQAAALYCSTAEFRSVGEGLDGFEAALLRPPYRALVTKLYREGKIPPQSSRSLASCDPHASAKYNGAQSAAEEERKCVVRWLEGRVAWARAVDAVLDATPDVATAKREYEQCKHSSDPLMVSLCELDVPSALAYRTVQASAEKLRAPNASDVLRNMARLHEQWVADMGRRCALQPDLRTAAPAGCWPQDFSAWRDKIEALVSEENQKAFQAAERASAVERECEVTWQGRQIRRYVTYYKFSNRLVLVEPATNMAGPPLQRIATKYEGQAAIVATGMLVELGRPWVFSNDPETQSLINGANGGAFMNAGQLGRNIVEHNVRFADASLSRGEYTYVARGGPELRSLIVCRSSKVG